MTGDDDNSNNDDDDDDDTHSTQLGTFLFLFTTFGLNVSVPVREQPQVCLYDEFYTGKLHKSYFQ